MKDFIFSYPVRIYFGDGALDKAQSEFDQIQDKVLLVYGEGSIKRNGLYDKVTSLLKEKGKEVVEFSGVMPNPTYQKVLEGASLAKKEKVGFVLAVGGGSVIDCAKVIAASACYEEDLWQLQFERGLRSDRSLPVGAILTIAGTGSEMNDIGVITNENAMIKRGMKTKAPLFAVLDPSYTLTIPKRQLFAAAFDTLSHALEAYLGQSNKDNVSDDIALAIARNTVNNIEHLLEDFFDMDARRNLMWDSAMAENGLTKIGKELDFTSHKIEHQLAVFTDCNHGEGLALILPAYYAYIKEEAKVKLERIAKLVFDKDGAEEGLKALKELVEKMGLPSSFEELASKVKIDEALLNKVAASVTIVKTGPCLLDHEDILKILKNCL